MSEETRGNTALSESNLDLLLSCLEEIEAHFGGEGIDGSTTSTKHLEAEDESADEKLKETSVFDAEEIEVAIDAFLSQLKDAKLIKTTGRGNVPSFRQAFAQLFGDTSSLSDRARAFEEYVEGYGGWVGYHDMQRAYETFVALKAELEEIRRGATGRDK